MVYFFKVTRPVIAVFCRHSVWKRFFFQASHGVIGVADGSFGGSQCIKLSLFIIMIGCLLPVRIDQPLLFVHAAPFITDGLSPGVCNRAHPAKGIRYDAGRSDAVFDLLQPAEGVIAVFHAGSVCIQDLL